MKSFDCLNPNYVYSWWSLESRVSNSLHVGDQQTASTSRGHFRVNLADENRSLVACTNKLVCPWPMGYYGISFSLNIVSGKASRLRWARPWWRGLYPDSRPHRVTITQKPGFWRVVRNAKSQFINQILKSKEPFREQTCSPFPHKQERHILTW